MRNKGTIFLLTASAVVATTLISLEYSLFYVTLISLSLIAMACGVYSPIIKLAEDKNFKIKKEKESHVKHIALWDRTTVDIPSLSYLQNFKFEAIYFCTTTGEKPDLSLLRPASQAKDIYHWEYRTDNKTNLKLYLLFALYNIHHYYGEDVVLHIFTSDPELKTRFKIHANGYKLNNLIFKTNEM